MSSIKVESNVAMKDKSFKKLDEETVFACAMNWIIHKMSQEASVKVRFRNGSKIYQVGLQYNGRNLRTKELELVKEDDEGFILYGWKEETNFNNLTTVKIQQGMDKADSKNQQKQNQVMECDEILMELFDIPVEMTEDDIELINDFLDV